jgi:hypothetical protein
MFRTLARAGLAVACAAGSAGAQSHLPPSPALIDDRVLGEVRAFLQSEIVIMSLEAQNRRHVGIGQAAIDDLDRNWVAERTAQLQPLVARTMSNPLSTYLKQVQAGTLGLYVEIFVMDAHGLNVGQSSVTSDYWQGDEAKYQKTFRVGPAALFIDQPEFNAETATWRAQVNLTLVRPSDGKPIGAATVEINLTELARRAAAA